MGIIYLNEKYPRIENTSEEDIFDTIIVKAGTENTFDVDNNILTIKKDIYNMRLLFSGIKADRIIFEEMELPCLHYMNRTFQDLKCHYLDLSKVNIPNTVDMTNAFNNAKIGLVQLPKIKASNLSGTFQTAYIEKINLENIDTSKTLYMVSTFASCCINNMELDISHFDFTEVVDTSFMLEQDPLAGYNMTYKTLVLPKDGYKNSNNRKMDFMFSGITINKIENIECLEFPRIESASNAFSKMVIDVLDLRSFSTDELRNARRMFCQSVITTYFNIPRFNMPRVSNVEEMFLESKIIKIYLERFNGKHLKNIENIFTNITTELIDISSLELTDKTTGGKAILRNVSNNVTVRCNQNLVHFLRN